jgi:hypothetical protein
MMSETLDQSVVVPRQFNFYLAMASACLAIAVIGFVPTYWRGLASGTFRGGPLIHLHALVFYGWMILYTAQTVLIARGQTNRHRAFGLIGTALATTLVISGMAVSITGGVRAEDAGYGPEARAFIIVSWSAMAVFGTLVSLAIANVTRPDRHRRLMLAATISMLGAPIARWFLVLLAPETIHSGSVVAPPPVFVSVPPALLGNLLFIAMLMHDQRTLGRFHPTTIKAATAVTMVSLLVVPISASNTWYHFAGWVMLLGR